jgi:hypothetical protein
LDDFPGVAAYTQLTHLFASRMEPGERELSDQDLRVIFGLSEVTAAVREQIAGDLHAAGVEVLTVDPLLVRKPEPPPVEPAAPVPRSYRPWYLAVGGVAAALALAVMLPDGQPTDVVVPGPLSTPQTHEPTRDIRPVEIARTREPKVDLPCEGRRLRSKCEERTRGRERRGR